MSIGATLIIQVLAFATLIWLVNKYLWAPMNGMLEERQKKVADGLAAGEKGRRDLELAEQRSKDLLAEVKQKQNEILAQAKHQATEMVEEAKSQAREEADRIVAAAKAEVDQEILRAREHLRKEISGIAVAGASKVLKKEIDAKAHDQLLSDLAAQI